MPQIRPRVAYLLLAINLGVYGAGLVAGLGPEGADAQQDYFLALAKTDVGVEAGEYYRWAHIFSIGSIAMKGTCRPVFLEAPDAVCVST